MSDEQTTDDQSEESTEPEESSPSEDSSRSDDSGQSADSGDSGDSDAETRSPDERLDDVGEKGTFDLEGSEEGEERESGTAGLPDEEDVPQETLDEIDQERSERLDADNRPDNVEVDNTQRTFDSGAGMFTDNEDYDEDERPYADEDDSGPPEDGQSDSDAAGDQQDDSTEDPRDQTDQPGNDDEQVNQDAR